MEKKNKVTNSTDKVSKIFIISLGSNREGRFQFKQTFEFSGPYTGIWHAKLTNHNAHTNRDI